MNGFNTGRVYLVTPTSGALMEAGVISPHPVVEVEPGAYLDIVPDAVPLGDDLFGYHLPLTHDQIDCFKARKLQVDTL
ncbi:MAG: hypothetical protein JSV63_02820 [Candidatus Aenigmatarchaeota archaeon]|nr:MAG: hypothetical protein JSV63_02820 [Candidatus Aenigmarchaeota archaeon]